MDSLFTLQGGMSRVRASLKQPFFWKKRLHQKGVHGNYFPTQKEQWIEMDKITDGNKAWF